MRYELWIGLIAAIIGVVAFGVSRYLNRREMAGWAEALFVVAVAAFIIWGGHIVYYTNDVDQRLTAAGGQVPAVAQPTEATFQGEQQSLVTLNTDSTRWWEFWKWSFNPDADKIREWRAARSDHWLVAYAILNCKKFPDIETMSGQTFSALLLDLTPNGDHAFKTGPKNGQKIVITPDEQTILSLSDSVSRARLSAVAGAAGSVVTVFWLGLAALIVSGLTTLFVTLQSRLTKQDGALPPAPAGTGRWDTFVKKWRNWWKYRGYQVVAFLAIFLSIVATTLAGIKQFYDPTRLVVQNQATLPKLWSLHQDVILGLTCATGQIEALPLADKDGKPIDRLSSWSSQMRELRSQIVLEYGAYVNSAGSLADRNRESETAQGPRPPPKPPAETRTPPEKQGQSQSETQSPNAQPAQPPSNGATAPTGQKAAPK